MRQDRLLEIVGRIYQRPETWDQTVYHSACGTAHCVAGHAQVDSGVDVRTGSTWPDAEMWLELDAGEAGGLFSPNRILEDLLRAAITGVCE